MTWVLIVLALLVVGGGAYYYGTHRESPPVQVNTNNPPANNQNGNSNTGVDNTWQTYTNTKYGFQFKYPLGWKTTNNTDNGVNIFESGDMNKDQISAWVYNTDPENAFRGTDNITGQSVYSLQGLSAKKLTGESGVTGKATSILIFKYGSNFIAFHIPSALFDQVVGSIVLSTPLVSSPSLEEQIKSATNKVLAQTAPSGSKLLSATLNVSGSNAELILNFNKTTVSQGNAPLVENNFQAISNAVNSIVQGTGIDPKYKVLTFTILIEGKGFNPN